MKPALRALAVSQPREPSLEKMDIPTRVPPPYEAVILYREAMDFSPHAWFAIPISLRHAHNLQRLRLEFLLLLEEHGEAHDGAVDQESTDDRHHHSADLDDLRVSENNREC